MKILDTKKEIPPANEGAPIQVVNQMIGRSFGRGWRGDYVYIEDDLHGYWVNLYAANDKPRLIAKRGLFWMIAGEFEEGDPTRIRVRPRHRKRAIEYAKMYEDFSGKEVTVNADPTINSEHPYNKLFYLFPIHS